MLCFKARKYAGYSARRRPVEITSFADTLVRLAPALSLGASQARRMGMEEAHACTCEGGCDALACVSARAAAAATALGGAAGAAAAPEGVHKRRKLAHGQVIHEGLASPTQRWCALGVRCCAAA